MSDSNPTRVRYAQNKAAFDEVIGDPFASPDPIEGEYYRLKRQTCMKVASYDDIGHGSKNMAKPLVQDFFCDVERIVESVIAPGRLKYFWAAYLYDDPDALTPTERNVVEQAIGRKFAAFKISPVRRYFISIRRPIGQRKVAAPLKGN